MRIRMLALVAGCMISGTATAQQWTDWKEIPKEELPIKLHLSGWEDGAWISRPVISLGKQVDHSSEARQYASYIRKGEYYGYLSYLETEMQRYWSDTTIRSQMERFSEFRGLELTYGDNGAVDNGAAEFRYLTVSYKKHGSDRTCFGFRGVWRTYSAYGYLCSSEVPVTAGTAETFLKSLGVGPSTAPVAGSLPTKG